MPRGKRESSALLPAPGIRPRYMRRVLERPDKRRRRANFSSCRTIIFIILHLPPSAREAPKGLSRTGNSLHSLPLLHRPQRQIENRQPLRPTSSPSGGGLSAGSDSGMALVPSAVCGNPRDPGPASGAGFSSQFRPPCNTLPWSETRRCPVNTRPSLHGRATIRLGHGRFSKA